MTRKLDDGFFYDKLKLIQIEKQVSQNIRVYKGILNNREITTIETYQGAERVYLCRAHVFAAERFHGLQQAVGAQELGMVMAVVRFVPADDALAQQGKPGDTTVGLTYVTAHLPDGFRAGFYLPDAFALMHQNGGHAADDRHHDNVACKNFKL